MWSSEAAPKEAEISYRTRNKRGERGGERDYTFCKGASSATREGRHFRHCERNPAQSKKCMTHAIYPSNSANLPAEKDRRNDITFTTKHRRLVVARTGWTDNS